MTSNCGVYKITNTVTGDFYIGSSVSLAKRFRDHRYTLESNYHRNVHLQNAWNKYGADNFLFEVILYCDKSMTLYYEQVLIDGLNPTYNIARVALAPFQGLKHTEEHKQKLSEVRSGDGNYFFGKNHTKESKRKISEAMKGRPFTEEHRRKISEAQMGERNHRFGKCFSEETRQKMSDSHMGEKNLNFGKHRSEETKRKISEANKGYKHTEEAKQRMSKSQTGRKHSEETKRKIGEANRLRYSESH